MDDRDPIAESLERADRGDIGGTLREARREFGAAGNIGRPDDRPQAGATILERMKARFMPRSADRDTARSQTR